MARADWMFSAAVARFRASASFSRRMASDSAICTFASFSPVTASEFDLDTRTLFSRSASADPMAPLRSASATDTRAVLIACAAASFVCNVGNVYVDEPQTDLLEFRFDVVGHRLKEFIAVRVDLLDLHRRDDQTHLTKDDVLRDLLDLVCFHAEEPFRRVLHNAGFRGDTDGESGRHVYTDILLGQGVPQVYGDGHRREIKVFVCLHHGPDEGRTAVDTLG